MLETDQEIIIAIFSGSALLLLMAGIVVLSALNYRKKQRLHKYQILRVKEAHEKEMLKASVEVREQTLQNIAEEIHDNVGQVLSLVKLNLNMANQKSESALVKTKLADSIGLTTKAINDLRDLSHTMNAEYLKNQSLTDLCTMELKQLEKVGGFTTELELLGNQRALNPDDRIIIYRIIQEIIQNIIKHAEAKKVTLKLHYETNFIFIAIKDDGKGFDTDVKSKGSGLQNLKHRCKLIHAALSINSQPNSGTEIQLKLNNA
ncbi:MAG: ATP-binding protein [Bacteroidota bacterium]